MEDKLRTQIGTMIRGLRKKAGLTISQLAELASMDGGFLNYIETGKKAPSLRTLDGIAKGLGVPLSKLFLEAEPRSIGSDLDFKISQQIRALLHGRTPTQKTDLLAILKLFRNPERVKALRLIMRK